MAQYQDNFGRNFDFGMNSNELNSTLGSAMQRPVGPQKTAGGTSPEFDKLHTAIQNSFKEFSKELHDAIKHVQVIVKGYKDQQKGKNHAKSVEKQSLSTGKTLKDLAKKGLKKGSIYVHDVHCEKILKDIHSVLSTAFSSRLKRSPPSGGSGIGGGGSGGAGGPSSPGGGGKGGWGNFFGNDPNKLEKDFNKSFNLKTVEAKIDGFFATLLGGNPFDLMFKGALTDEFKFVQQLQQALFTTQGLTEENGELQKQWGTIEDAVTNTGFRREKFQEEYVKQLKKGIKDQKTLNRLVTTELNLEKALGVEAGEMSDTFATWTQSFEMGQDALSQMSRNIRDVAKFTGLTGKNLTEAVKGSQNVMKALAFSGNLTAEASKNVMTAIAQAQKLGVSDEVNKFLLAASSLNNFTDAAPAVQALLARTASRAGLSEQLMMGTLTKDRKNFAAMSNSLFSEISNIAGQEVKSMEDLASLPDEVKRRLDVVYKEQGGIGAVLKTAQSMAEAGKSFDERIKELQDKKAAGFGGPQAMAAIDQEIKRLQSGQSLEGISKVSENLTKGRSVDDALRASGMSKDDLTKSFETSISTLNEGAVKHGFDQINPADIQRAMQSPENYKAFTEQINLLEQKINETERSNADPVSKIEKTVNEINETLKEGLFGWLQEWGGEILYTLMAIEGASKAWSLLKMLPGMGGKGGVGMGGFFGKGGTMRNMKAMMLGRTGLGGASGGVGMGARTAKFMGKAGKFLGPVGMILGAGLDFADRKAEGQSTMQAVAGTAGGVAGGLAGAAIGASIGSVVPVVGTAIGGLVGGVLGYFGGGAVMDAVTGAKNSIVDYTKDILGGMYEPVLSVTKFMFGGMYDTVTLAMTSISGSLTGAWDSLKQYFFGEFESANKIKDGAKLAATMGGNIDNQINSSVEAAKLDPSKIPELDRQLDGLKMALEGNQKNLAQSQAEHNQYGFFSDPFGEARAAIQSSIDYSTQETQKYQAQINHLEAEIGALKGGKTHMSVKTAEARTITSANNALIGNDPESMVARNKVENEASASDIGIGALTSENETQTELQARMVSLLERLVSTQQIDQDEGVAGKKASMAPPKYYGSNVGSHNKTSQNYISNG